MLLNRLTQHGCVLFLMLLPAPGWSQNATISGRIDLTRLDNNKQKTAAGTVDKSNVVVWLTPEDSDKSPAPDPASQPHAQLVQKDKSFKPHVLVVRAGTAVDFPNRDPLFHNVFSLFEGKRFDLGLYEAGSSRTVHFDRPGVSYIFCNIHPEMSAVVVAVPTPYYGASDRTGQVSIANVPSGRYVLHVWHEGSMPDQLKSLTREIVVSGDAASFGTLHITEAAGLYQAHKNKYGRDYDSQEPTTSVYSH
jgi:plastocyanin